MNSITISFKVKPSLLQEERAKLYPIRTIKQFKAATLKLDKLKKSMLCELHVAYALEAKIEEAAVLLKKQAVKAQGIYNTHLSTTPIELSNPDMAPIERSNKMSGQQVCYSCFADMLLGHLSISIFLPAMGIPKPNASLISTMACSLLNGYA